MKDTPEIREKLARAMTVGKESRDLLKRLDPKFVAMRETYRANLVNAVRNGVEEREIVLRACRITALEDLYETIYQEAVTGVRAQRAATELEENSGKH